MISESYDLNCSLLLCPPHLKDLKQFLDDLGYSHEPCRLCGNGVMGHAHFVARAAGSTYSACGVCGRPICIDAPQHKDDKKDDKKDAPQHLRNVKKDDKKDDKKDEDLVSLL